MVGFRLFLWSAAATIAALGTALPSDECLRISQDGTFESVNWTYFDAQTDPSTSFRQWHDDGRSFMLLPQTGMYEGAENIHEYMSTLSISSALESSPIIIPRSGVGYVQQYERTVIDPNGEESKHTMCSYLSASLYVPTYNSSIAVDVFNMGTFTLKMVRLTR